MFAIYLSGFSRFCASPPPPRSVCACTVHPDRVYGWTWRARERDFIRKVGPTNPDRPRGERRAKKLFPVRVPPSLCPTSAPRSLTDLACFQVVSVRGRVFRSARGLTSNRRPWGWQRTKYARPVLVLSNPIFTFLPFRERNRRHSIRLRRSFPGDVSGNRPRREPFQVLGSERSATEQQRCLYGRLSRALASAYVFSPTLLAPFCFRSRCEVCADETPNVYQRIILLSSMGIILAGKPPSFYDLMLPTLSQFSTREP